MKNTFKLIIAVLATTAFLASCSKESAVEKSNPEFSAEGFRTIAVSFETPTKTYLDSLKPRFCEKDSILLSDGTALDTCGVIESEGRAFIITKLVGNAPLRAVYPYTAAVMDENDPKVITGFKVPNVQTGRFKDANICATIIQNDQARFHNEVAILKFYAGEELGVDSIKVKSSFQITGDFSKAAQKMQSITDQPEFTVVDSIVVKPIESSGDEEVHPGEDLRIWYVAVMPTSTSPEMVSAKSADPQQKLEFISYTNTQGTVTRRTEIPSFNRNRIYNAFIPYYITVNVGTDDAPVNQKWAYCNLGAFLPEDPGLYYTWGNTQPFNPYLYHEEFLFTKQSYSESSHAEKEEQFTDYDAADRLGGPWRTPTKEELVALASYIEDSSPEVTRKGISIILPKMTFPFTGTFDNEEPATGWTDNTSGYFWSRTDANGSNKAFAMVLSEDSFGVEEVACYKGCTIRPIYGDTANASIEKYNNGNDEYNNGNEF